MVNQFSLRQAANIAAVALVLGVSWYLFDSDYELPQLITRQDRVPDYQMKNFTTTSYDQHGNIAFEMFGAQLAHYNSVPDRAEIDSPTYLEYQDGVSQLSMRADVGVAINSSEIVELKRNVTLEKQSENEDAPTVMTTDYLRVLPDRHYAETDAPVTIVGPEFQTRAVGMNIDTHNSVVKLLSDVQSVHTPRIKQ